MHDLVIREATIVDGTGKEAFSGDIAIRGDTIVEVGKVDEPGWREVWVDGLVAAPGFIDIHSHSDFALLLDGRAMSKVMQGVTTEVVGNCGISPHPAPREMHQEIAEVFGYAGFVEEAWDFETTGEFLSRLRGRTSVNVLALVGHGTLRVTAMGFKCKKASGEDLSRMCELLKRSLSEGAAGLSAGLVYPPSSYADVGELSALAKVAERQGRIFSCHIRSEADRLLDSLEEMAEVSRRSGVFVEVSHLKCPGRKNWGRAEEALSWFEQKVEEGMRLGYDAYPYEASSTHLSAYLPSWLHEGGPKAMLERLRKPEFRERAIKELKGPRAWKPSDIMLASLERERDLVGLRLDEAANRREKSPEELLLDLVAKEGGRALVISFVMSQEDMDKIVCSPLGAIGSDGLAVSPGGPFPGTLVHPRTYGTFPRVLRRHVRELGLLTLEEAVRKMTFLPATRLRLSDRGVIRPGAKADIVILRLDEVEDTATYSNPHSFPKGIEWVFVNGVGVVEHGRHTSETPGKVVRLDA